MLSRRPSNRLKKPQGDVDADLVIKLSVALATVLVTAIGLSFAGFWRAENLRYASAMARIEMEREQASEAQKTERLRIEKTSTPATNPPPDSGVGASGAMGFSLLRELIAKAAAAPGEGNGRSGQRSTSAIAGMVDALASAGQITASEAKSFKDDLQKAGLEIGVDAAKALVDRFIKVHDKPAAAGESGVQLFQGANQFNLYCSAPPVRVVAPPIRPSAPRKACT